MPLVCPAMTSSFWPLPDILFLPGHFCLPADTHTIQPHNLIYFILFYVQMALYVDVGICHCDGTEKDLTMMHDKLIQTLNKLRKFVETN